MKYTEFGSLLDEEPAHIAFFSTFQFDPDFFERRLLRRCSSLLKARRIIVFMDAGEWTTLLRQDVRARWINQRYLVIPIHRSTGVFHPKLSLLLSQKGGRVLCGSNNLTRSGCSNNLELLNCLPFEFEERYEEEMRIASEAFRFFKGAVKNTENEIGRIAEEWIEETESMFGWLNQATENTELRQKVQLIHSYDGSIWDQLIECLEQRPPEEFFIISPFHDKNCETALKLSKQYPTAKINFIVQSGYTTLNVQPLRSINRIQLLELQNSESSRRIHAKLVAWTSGNGSGCLVGSANFTGAALKSRNVETCLLIDSEDDLTESLFDKQLNVKPIQFDDFETGSIEEPSSEDRENPLLKLSSVILLEGSQIQVSFSHTLGDMPTSLRLTIRGLGEENPRISELLSNKQEGVDTVTFHENALSDSHGSLIAILVAETPNGNKESDPFWIIQPHRLTYEPSDGSSSSKSRIEEYGEGLPEYLEEIGKRDGIAGVVEYLDHLNIRFNDGGKNSMARKFRIQIRDPFTFDTIPDWLVQAKAKSDDLAKAINEFTKRHEKRRLRKHASNGNINGIENFIDIMRAMVRLNYAYYRQENVPINKGHVIEVITRCIELAMDGVDDENDLCDGFIYSMWNCLGGDVKLLQEVLAETCYAAEIRAILLIAQKLRFNPDAKSLYGKKADRPKQELSQWSSTIRKILSECEIEEPSADEVQKTLETYQMFSEQEIVEMIAEM